MMANEAPVFSLWSEFLGWLLDRTEKFPKKVRFTFASRIDNLALDVLSAIIRASYDKDKARYLQVANQDINVLRVLLRLSCERRYLTPRAHEHAAREIDEAGRMIGGWSRSLS